MRGLNACLSSLSVTLIEHVDAVCDRFERAWKAGERPRIAEYLAEEVEPGRSVLVRELLAAELEWRRRLGESPTSLEYRDLVAEFGLIIDAAFQIDGEGWESPGNGALPDPLRLGLSPENPRFRILRRHAEGGLGVVYVARDEELHREVALKEIQPRLASRPEIRERFLLEAEINGGLEHPGIVPVYSLGRHPDGRPFYAMRLIQGTSLKEAIAEFHGKSTKRDPGGRMLGLRKLLDCFRSTCNTLAYAHSRGIVHRDVKPHNIMVGRFGETIVLDWGLAKSTGQPEAIDGTVPPPPHSTGFGASDGVASGSTVGTPAYMSPEQADGRSEQVGAASDIYGLGATLYQILTGRPPFEGNKADVLERVRRGDFPRPRSANPGVPRGLEAACRKAMATRPEDRYATALELADDIERWLADEPVSAWREPWPDRTRRWLKHHRTFLIAGVAAILLTTLVLGGCVLMWCLDRGFMGPMSIHDHRQMVKSR